MWWWPTVGMAQTPPKQSKIAQYFKQSDPHKGRIIPFPMLNYSPETSWSFGLGVQYLFRTPSTDSTGNMSTIGFASKYTLNQQFIISPTWDVFWMREKRRLTGQVLWQRYPDFFFGLGNNTADDPELYSADYLVMENRYSRQILPKLHIGAQHRLEHMYNLRPTLGNGFIEGGELPGLPSYTASGVGLALIYDSREHLMAPRNGWYALLSHHTYSRYFGGNTDLTSLRADVRKYLHLGGNHVLAAQIVGEVHSGEPPFKMMSTFGGQELLRGYFYGRYRDKHMYAAQAEYRFPIAWRFLGAAFVGVGNTAGPYSQPDFRYLKVAGGGGIRFAIDPKERIHLRFDAAFGMDGSRGFYFAIGEAF